MKKILAYISTLSLVLTFILPTGFVNAEITKSIRRDFAEQAIIYHKNLSEFQKLNKKIHNRDLKKTLEKLKNCKKFIIPASLFLICFTINALGDKEVQVSKISQETSPISSC